MEKVDVVVLTKNSSITLDLVLKGIFKSIPVNKLIVVDGYSTDDTLKTARKYGARIIHEKGKLGRARYMGALEVETNWFCFIDSDIFLFPSWYRRLEKWMRLPGVVWIVGRTLEHSKIFESYARSKILGHKRWEFARPVALSNSLLKRDVVLDCTEWLRDDIHGGEDRVLYEFVESKGYQMIKDTSFFACIHLPDCFLHDIFAAYRAGYSYRLRHKKIQFKYLGIPAFFLRKAVVGFLETLDPRLFAYCSIIQGSSFLAKYLGIAGERLDMFIDRLEKASELTGVSSFLHNPRDAEGNSIAL